MRIIYYIHFNLSVESGVFKKIVAQANEWRRLGQTVYICAITRVDEVEERVSNMGEYGCCVRYSGSNFLLRLKTFSISARYLYQKILKWKPDIIYTRLDLYNPYFEMIAKEVPVVFEINSDEMAEFAISSKMRWYYHALTRDRLFRYCAGLVFVTNELSARKHFTKFLKTQIVIPNGIDLSGLVQTNALKRKDVHLCFIGQGAYPWHGIDKVGTIASAYNDWTFHIIGCRQDDFPSVCYPNMIYYGSLRKPEYIPLLANSDCAIGTLALHRKGMQEACPLKTREYLSLGLPVIIGYKDTDFTESVDYILQLDNHEQNIDNGLSRIREFVEYWKGSRVDISRINHLSYKEKEVSRVAFFASLLASNK